MSIAALEAVAADANARWPVLTPGEAQDAKDAAWTLYVTLYRTEQGDPAVHRANYLNQIAMIETAAGFAS